jgi:hypothetical protein
MSYDMLYPQKNYDSIGKTRLEPFTLLQPNCMSTLPLKWFASIIPKYTHGFVPGY